MATTDYLSAILISGEDNSGFDDDSTAVTSSDFDGGDGDGDGQRRRRQRTAPPYDNNDDDRGPFITFSIDPRTASIDGLTSSIVLRLYLDGVVSIAPRLYLGGICQAQVA